MRTLEDIEADYVRNETVLNQAQVKKELLRQELLDFADGEQILGSKLAVKFQTRKGLVQYKNIPEVAAMSAEELNAFRAPSKTIPIIKVF